MMFDKKTRIIMVIMNMIGVFDKKTRIIMIVMRVWFVHEETRIVTIIMKYDLLAYHTIQDRNA